MQYKEENHLTWYELAVKSGVSIPQIMRLAKKNEEQLLTMTLRLAKLLKKNLKINLI